MVARTRRESSDITGRPRTGGGALESAWTLATGRATTRSGELPPPGGLTVKMPPTPWLLKLGFGT